VKSVQNVIENNVW